MGRTLTILAPEVSWPGFCQGSDRAIVILRALWEECSRTSAPEKRDVGRLVAIDLEPWLSQHHFQLAKAEQGGNSSRVGALKLVARLGGKGG